MMIILGGDFNCPEVEWVSGSLVDSYITANFHKSLITFAHNSMLEQIVTQPTRENNILDLCFITHPDYIEQCTTVPGFSDHDVVIVDLINLHTSHNKHERKIYFFIIEQTGMLSEKRLLQFQICIIYKLE